MIAKTIKFSDSPVMNELVKKYPVFSAIQKTAATKKIELKPTQNFDQDVVILCNQLRERGFEKEAKSLEYKLNLKKQAEVHLYNVHNETAKDVLDFAHPEGDAKVAEAPYQLGDIETLESVQKKMLNSLVASALDIDLKKISQKTDMEADPDLPSDLTDIELNETAQKKVGEINQYLNANWPKIGTNIKQAIFSIGVDESGTPTALLSFKPEHILAKTDSNAPGTSDYLGFFASKSGVSKADLENFVNLYKNLYGENEFSPATIYNRLFQINDYWPLKQFVSSIDTKIASQFFRGSRIIDKDSISDYVTKANKDERLADNQQSVWWTSYGDEFKIDAKALNSAAEAIHNVMQANYRRFIIDPIPQANQAVISEIFGYLMPLTTMLKEGNVNFNIVPIVKNSTGFITSALRAYMEILNQFSTAQTTGRAIYNILGSMLLPTSFFGSINAAASSISDILKYLSDPANIINPKTDIIPSKSVYTDISEKFKTAARRLNFKVKSMKETGDTASAELNTYIKRLNRAYNAYKIVSNSVNQPFNVIQSQLAAFFPKIDSFDALKTEADSWLEGTATLATAAKMMQTIIKQSAYGDDEPTSKAKPSGSPTVKIPTKTPVSNTIISLSPEEKEAVQGMQLSLFTLGQYIKTYGSDKFASIKDQISNLALSLIRTGQGLGASATKNQFDGAWGPNTANAVKSAQIILSAWNKNYPNYVVEGELEAGPLMKQPAVIDKANSNSNTINQLIRSAFGISIGTDMATDSGNAYDRVEQELNDSTLTSALGKIPVAEKNLSSLPNFYQYLIENGFAKPEFVEGQEGLSTKLWKNILSWFEGRSQWLLGNADKAKKGTALAYRRSVNDLKSKFDTLNKYYKLQDDQLVPMRILGQTSSESSQKSKPFGHDESGETMALAPGEKGNKKNLIPIKYRGDQTIGEGRNVKLPPPEDDTPPIGKTLDLRRTEWFDIDYNKLAYPILDLDQFTRTPATTLASMMFGGERDTQAQYQDMIEANIPAAAVQWNRYTGEYNIYMVTNNRGAWYSLSNLQKQPWFIATYPVLAAKSRNPIDQFEQFLFNLSRGLHQTAARWSSETDATEEEINISQNYSGRWLRAIKLKLNQIQDWRSTR